MGHKYLRLAEVTGTPEHISAGVSHLPYQEPTGNIHVLYYLSRIHRYPGLWATRAGSFMKEPVLEKYCMYENKLK